MSTTVSKKPKKISTTIRFDADLMDRTKEYARKNNMNFSTFLKFSAQYTMKNGAKMEPYYEVSDEYARKLDEMVAQYERGELKAAGPFKGKAAIDFLKTLY